MENAEKKEWTRDWIGSLDPDKLTLYPLQLANCKRLEENDAVYIFDEVGCGKTISAGLMAMHYLHRRSDDDSDCVLVITDCAVEYQFREDLLEHFPLEKEGLFYSPNLEDSRNRIVVINNHCKNIEKVLRQWLTEKRAKERIASWPARHFGMIVIDEAHGFLNTDTERYKALVALGALGAEKVVFLTATPIRESLYDLKTYVKLAQALLPGAHLSDSWIDAIRRTETRREVLCGRFDPTFPVTRYFKDTMQALQNGPEHQTRRCLPHIWEYDLDPSKSFRSKTDWDNYGWGMKFNALVEHIGDIVHTGPADPPDRFLIFVHQVERKEKTLGGVKLLAAWLRENLVKKNPAFFPNGGRDVEEVTGENDGEVLGRLQDADKPRILVINYQVGERGINLPDYNYVINFHISNNPAALEQRFGRIDRLGSKYGDIHVCYLIRSRYWDTDTENFYTALGRYRYGLLPCLPAKNTILDEGQVKMIYEAQVKMLELSKRFQALLTEPGLQDTLKVCEAACRKGLWGIDPSWPEELGELIHFCRQKRIWWQGNSDGEKRGFVEKLRSKITDAVNNITDTSGEMPTLQDLKKRRDEELAKLEEMGDKIMFTLHEGEPPIYLDAVEECARTIQEDMDALPEDDPWTRVLRDVKNSTVV